MLLTPTAVFLSVASLWLQATALPLDLPIVIRRASYSVVNVNGNNPTQPACTSIVTDTQVVTTTIQQTVYSTVTATSSIATPSIVTPSIVTTTSTVTVTMPDSVSTSI